MIIFKPSFEDLKKYGKPLAYVTKEQREKIMEMNAFDRKYALLSLERQIEALKKKGRL